MSSSSGCSRLGHTRVAVDNQLGCSAFCVVEILTITIIAGFDTTLDGSWAYMRNGVGPVPQSVMGVSAALEKDERNEMAAMPLTARDFIMSRALRIPMYARSLNPGHLGKILYSGDNYVRHLDKSARIEEFTVISFI
jgi:hypothetical protein